MCDPDTKVSPLDSDLQTEELATEIEEDSTSGSNEKRKIHDVEKLERLCMEGYSLRYIAQELGGVSFQAVEQYIKRHRIKRPKNIKVTLRKEKIGDADTIGHIVNLYMDGNSKVDIANQLDKNVLFVDRCIKVHEREHRISLKEQRASRFDKQIISLYKRGYGVMKISKRMQEQYNIILSHNVVLRRLRKNNIQINDPIYPLKNSQIRRIQKEWRNGEKTVSQVAKKLNVSRFTVKKYIRQIQPGV